jgi:UDP-N-acetyl-D-glucosamine dehydrogenase
VINSIMKTDVNYFDNLWDKIDNKSAIIGIVGLGYVGLSNIILKIKEGFNVIGFDINQEQVDKINNKINSLNLKNKIEEKKFRATTNFEDLSMVDVIHVCISIPINEYKQSTLDYIQKFTDLIAKHVSKGSLIVIEGIMFPFTIKENIVKELESNGFVIGQDIFVTYSFNKLTHQIKTTKTKS